MDSKRQRRLAAQKLLKQAEGKFEPIDLEGRPFVPPGMTRAFRNNRYTVMIYDNYPTDKSPATLALIQNHFDAPIVNHWRELQRIKNEIFGPQVTAVEYYPAESELIDDNNIYWLVVFEDGVLPKLSHT